MVSESKLQVKTKNNEEGTRAARKSLPLLAAVLLNQVFRSAVYIQKIRLGAIRVQNVLPARVGRLKKALLMEHHPYVFKVVRDVNSSLTNDTTINNCQFLNLFPTLLAFVETNYLPLLKHPNPYP